MTNKAENHTAESGMHKSCASPETQRESGTPGSAFANEKSNPLTFEPGKDPSALHKNGAPENKIVPSATTEPETRIPSDGSTTDDADQDRLETVEEKWEKAGIGNAFIFGKVMSENPDLLLELLQLSLPEFEIKELVEPTKEVSHQASYDSKGVRLDVQVRDISGRVFNVEMQLRDEKNIPHRMRYYSSTLDTTILKAGQDYNQLRDTVVLFITTFDPFKKNLYRYTFRNICLEDRELELRDGTSKIILNASGCISKDERKAGTAYSAESANKEQSDKEKTNKEQSDKEKINKEQSDEEMSDEKINGGISDDLKGFLQLVMGTKPPEGADDSFAGRLQKSVEAAKRDSAMRREFMNWEMTLTVERNKGRAEGKAEGRAEGRAEGKIEGRGEGELLKLVKQILKKLSKGQNAEKIADDLMEDLSLVETICGIISESNSSDPEKILSIIKARQTVSL